MGFLDGPSFLVGPVFSVSMGPGLLRWVFWSQGNGILDSILLGKGNKETHSFLHGPKIIPCSQGCFGLWSLQV